jgi:hypothetical protein
VQPVHRVRADAGDDVAQIGLGLHAVERGRAERGAPGSGVTAGEEPVLSSEGDGPDGILGRVDADLQLAVLDVSRQRMPSRTGVANGAGEIALGRDADALSWASAERCA